MEKLSFADARHLVARTGIGVEWRAIKRLQGRTRAQAVELVLHQAPSAVRPPPPMTPWQKLEPMRQKGNRSLAQVHMIAKREGEALQAWWLNHMLSTRSPFVERMTLFWHGYFTSSVQKTLQPDFLYQQNVLLRRQSVGNFGAMLKRISRDPAMLVYLDADKNVKSSINENFARELLELFTVGRGAYTQHDVRAAARAFTGWGVDRRSGRFVIRADQHDDRRVVFMKRAGQFDGDDIIEILLRNPLTAKRLAKRLWHEFVSPNPPSNKLIEDWSNRILKTQYDIKGMMRLVLNSADFWDARNRGTLIKSPVEVLIGTLRTASYERLSPRELVNLCRLLGQKLFDPPSVKGWDGGEHWITTQSLLVRASYLAKITRGNLNQFVNTGLDFPAKNKEEMLEWLLAVPPVNPLPTTPGKRRLAHALLKDPAFQVT